VEAVVQLMLIPRWSYFGACAGTLIGEVLFTAAGLVICRRLGLGRIDVKAMTAAGLAAAVMAAMLWPVHDLPLPLLIGAATFSLAIYLFLCVTLGALRGEEVRRCWLILTSYLRPTFPGKGEGHLSGGTP
jgi:O-antigen/teichoic acid export membrane protein